MHCVVPVCVHAEHPLRPERREQQDGWDDQQDEREPEPTHGPHEVEAVDDDFRYSTASGTITYWMRAKTPSALKTANASCARSVGSETTQTPA